MDAHRLGLVSMRIHYFQTVAQLRSIRGTAQALNVAPSAISRTVQALATALGLPLFERVRQRLKLTSAGAFRAYRERPPLFAGVYSTHIRRTHRFSTKSLK